MDYSRFQNLARKMIGNAGAKCKLVILGDQVYEPGTNSYIYPNRKEWDGYCLIGSYEEKLYDGTVIQVGDLKVSAVLPVEPKLPGSALEIYNATGGLVETYQIINCLPINPLANAVVMYKMQCRK